MLKLLSMERNLSNRKQEISIQFKVMISLEWVMQVQNSVAFSTTWIVFVSVNQIYSSFSDTLSKISKNRLW